MPRTRAMEAAVFAAPLAILALVKLLIGFGPVESEAVNQDQAQADQTAQAVDGVDKAMNAWIASLDIKPNMRSPMDHGPTQQVEPIVPIDSVYRPPVFRNPLANAKLTSVMGSGSNGLASIDGKLYAVGDQPAPGCRIVVIDARERFVQIELPSGEAFFIRVDEHRRR